MGGGPEADAMFFSPAWPLLKTGKELRLQDQNAQFLRTWRRK
jgi:hypothetical protein